MKKKEMEEIVDGEGSSRFLMEEVNVKLTDDEWALRSDEMGKTVLELENYQAEKKVTMTELAAGEKALNKKIQALGLAIRTHSEPREVECYENPNLVRMYVEVIRRDTGEVVKTRPMTDGERANAKQIAFGDDRDLFGVPAKKEKSPIN